MFTGLFKQTLHANQYEELTKLPHPAGWLPREYHGSSALFPRVRDVLEEGSTRFDPAVLATDRTHSSRTYSPSGHFSASTLFLPPTLLPCLDLVCVHAHRHIHKVLLSFPPVSSSPPLSCYENS